MKKGRYILEISFEGADDLNAGLRVFSNKTQKEFGAYYTVAWHLKIHSCSAIAFDIEQEEEVITEIIANESSKKYELKLIKVWKVDFVNKNS
ncbi:hypothetical protein HM1_1162 [Heliomicrobium modesticaldum Ice1]|uniref:Uncharacterized protein n=1 Tax=Heliobacterium modesticaldum (strain ATCC 51547 / Ice1) TaxID=498761 RepID=B0THH4_HELMI|nr:hypothetical protein [Heliomicrobium modesticaldum]ABZ83412.1 hypothetical protein HM1_1162 [Heliomicrobium modesticaldum Ice1]